MKNDYTEQEQRRARQREAYQAIRAQHRSNRSYLWALLISLMGRPANILVAKFHIMAHKLFWLLLFSVVLGGALAEALRAAYLRFLQSRKSSA